VVNLAAVKAELARAPVGKLCCRKAETVVAVRFAGALGLTGGQVVVEAELDSAAAAERLRVNLLEVFGHRAQVGMLPPSLAQGRGRRRWVVRVAPGGALLAHQVGFLDENGYPTRGSAPPVPPWRVCDAEAFWRAALLASGSPVWQGNTRALHVNCPTPEAALALVEAARRLGYPARAHQSPGGETVVISDHDTVTALLTRLGAPLAAPGWAARPNRAPAPGPGPAGRVGLHAADRARAATAARVAQARQVRSDVGSVLGNPRDRGGDDRGGPA
jgi:cell division protein WhiA